MPVDGERQTGARVDDDVDEALRCSCMPDADVRLRVASMDASLLSDFCCFCCCCCCCGEYFMPVSYAREKLNIAREELLSTLFSSEVETRNEL